MFFYGLIYDGSPGLEEIKGDMIDISEWVDFEFYDYVWYWDETEMDMMNNQQLIGRWLGFVHHIGSNKTYWIRLVM
jgi:hypothetical protein